RAPHPRHDARRLDAVHARRRGRGAVAARRRDRRGVAARPARVPELSGRIVGAPERRRSPPAGRQVVATSVKELAWYGEDVCLAAVNAALARLRTEAAAEGS